MCPGASSAPRPRRSSSLGELLLLVEVLLLVAPLLEPDVVAELPDELALLLLALELLPPDDDLPDEPLPDEPELLLGEPDELPPSLASAERLPVERSAAESRAATSGAARRE
jgi:hypothetical protein